MKATSLQVFSPGYTSYYYTADEYEWRIYPDKIIVITRDGKRKTVFKGTFGGAITYAE